MALLLQNAAYGTALILAAALLRQTLKDRLLPGARLLLWALCLLRLLTPVPLESALSLWGLFQPRQAPAPTPAPVPTPQLYIPALTSPAPAPQPAPAISWEMVLLAAWLLVGLALAVRYVTSWKRTRRAVFCAIPVHRPDPRYAPLPKCARLREGPMEGAPLTFGALRPTVVLSPGLEGETLECVLVHEGVHARRRDNLWHYAMALALVVHWWNPAVWLMARLLRRDIELSCDRAALKKLGTERRADYANALLSLATQAKGPAFCQTFGRKAAEERILSVMKFKKTSIMGVVLSLALVLAVTAAFACEPKEPQDSYDSQKVSSTTKVTVLPDEDATTSSAPAGFSYGMTTDPDSGALKSFTINLDYLEKNLAQHVADGTMTQEEADRALSLAREAAQGSGRLEWVFQGDSGLVDISLDENGNHRPGFNVYYKDTDGNLVPIDPATVVSAFIFPAAGEDHPGYVLEGETAGISEYMLDDYVVKPPTFDEDGNPILSDAGITGQEFYSYEFVTDSSAISGGPVQTSSGTAPAVNPPCRIEGCTEVTAHQHDGRWYCFMHPVCSISGCTLTGEHFHDGVAYSCNGTGHLGPNGSCDGSCSIPSNTVPAGTAAQSRWPANSKGQTYGTIPRLNPGSPIQAGDYPDLIAVSASADTGGKEGYILHSYTHPSYPGTVSNPDEAMKYMDWLDTQPDVLVEPLYNSEGDVIGEFRTSNPVKGGSNNSNLVGTPEDQSLTRIQDQIMTGSSSTGVSASTSNDLPQYPVRTNCYPETHHSETHHSDGHH